MNWEAPIGNVSAENIFLKKFRVFLVILFVGSLPLSLNTCGGGGGSAQPISIAVSPANTTIPVGLTQQFTATGTYADGTTRDITTQVGWNSSNISVVTVNGSGLATAVAAGTATITGFLGTSYFPPSSISGSTTLTVTSATLSSMVITPANPSIPLQISQQFTATGTFSDGTTHDLTSEVSWSSSNTSVATINSSGLAVAVAAGITTITAGLEGFSENTTLTVTSATLSSLSLAPANSTISVGATQQFSATGTFSDGSTLDITGSVTWGSSNPPVATVNSGGLATAVAAGTTTITASSGAFSASASLTVISATLSSIVVTPANSSIPVGATQQFTATGTFSDGSTRNISGSVTWSSSNTSVATINSSGLATAVAAGTATMTAASGTISGGTTVTVTSK